MSEAPKIPKQSIHDVIAFAAQMIESSDIEEDMTDADVTIEVRRKSMLISRVTICDWKTPYSRTITESGVKA